MTKIGYSTPPPPHCPEMLALHILLLTKLPGTYFAGVWPLASVHSHVNGQLRSLIKPCPTLSAIKRLFFRVCCMSSHVVFDMSLERFVANITLVHFLPLVKREDMSFQSICPRICLGNKDDI